MFRRTLLTGLLVMSLLTLTILGAPQAAQTSSHGAKCLAMILNGSPPPCPEKNLLNFINFHFNAFEIFSQAQIDVGLTLTLFLILLLVPAVTPVLKNVFLPLGFLPSFSLSSFKPNFHRWLSFHENSPNGF